MSRDTLVLTSLGVLEDLISDNLAMEEILKALYRETRHCRKCNQRGKSEATQKSVRSHTKVIFTSEM